MIKYVPYMWYLTHHVADIFNGKEVHIRSRKGQLINWKAMYTCGRTGEQIGAFIAECGLTTHNWIETDKSTFDAS